jgi:DNA-binding GntR family transcriptional regulator
MRGIAVPDSVYIRGFDAFAVPSSATIIEQAVSKLRNAIMQGELRPGQKLVEAELCRTLDISRASLREALRALETERLIALVPNRGPSVARLTYDDVDAIHEVWALLTGEAVADFARMAKTKDLSELKEAMNALSKSIEHNMPLEQLAATNAFFMQIMRKCGNGVLAEVVISLVSRVNFLRAQALLHQGWGVLYAQEIQDILNAICDRNPDAARVAARKHIASACAAAKQLSLNPELAPMDKSRMRGSAAKRGAKAKPAPIKARIVAKKAKAAEAPSRVKSAPAKKRTKGKARV